MALTREYIRKLAKESDVELPKEFIDGIITEHTNARDAYAEEQVKAELAKQPNTKAENVKETEEYKKLEKSFNDYKADVEAKEAKVVKEKAYRDILKDASLSEKGIEKAIKYADWEKIEIEDGKVKDAANHVKAVKEEWAEYVTTKRTTGTQTYAPPANNGGSGNGKTRDEILAIKDGAQRRAEMVKNAHLFPEMSSASN